MSTIDPLLQAARALVAQLKRMQRRIVFAESCTAGLIPATMARIPGVSEWLAGSAVVYQPETKTEWLNVRPAMFDAPGIVSRDVAEAMATGVLATTPHAWIAASVTGHLGPDAPPNLDGVAWAACVVREGDPTSVSTRELNLNRPEFHNDRSLTLREQRQRTAAILVMQFATKTLARL